MRVQTQLAERQQSEAFKCVQNEKAELVALSGFSVEMTEGDLTDLVGERVGVPQAEKQVLANRDHEDVVHVEEGLPAEPLDIEGA